MIYTGYKVLNRKRNGFIQIFTVLVLNFCKVDNNLLEQIQIKNRDIQTSCMEGSAQTGSSYISHNATCPPPCVSKSTPQVVTHAFSFFPMSQAHDDITVIHYQGYIFIV